MKHSFKILATTALALLALTACEEITVTTPDNGSEPAAPADETNYTNPAVLKGLDAKAFDMVFRDIRPQNYYWNIYKTEKWTIDCRGYFHKTANSVYMNPDRSSWVSGDDMYTPDNIVKFISQAKAKEKISCGMPTELVVLPVLKENGKVINEKETEIEIHTTVPVNMSASKCFVNVTRSDDAGTAYTLTYGSLSGTAMVYVWNGADRYDDAPADCRISFPVHGNVEIPIRGIQIQWRKGVHDMNEFAKDEKIDYEAAFLWDSELDYKTETKITNGARYRIIGPVPYNATPHYQLKLVCDTFQTRPGDDPNEGFTYPYKNILDANSALNPDFFWWAGLMKKEKGTTLTVYPWEIYNRQFITYEKNFGFKDNPYQNSDTYSFIGGIMEELEIQAYRVGDESNYRTYAKYAVFDSLEWLVKEYWENEQWGVGSAMKWPGIEHWIKKHNWTPSE